MPGENANQFADKVGGTKLGTTPEEHTLRTDPESATLESMPEEGANTARSRGHAAMGAPGLQRTQGMPQNQMSTIDDGYDSEAMAKIEANIRREVDAVKNQCYKQIEIRLQEEGTDLRKRIDGIEMSYKS